jgi:hypothetical protein
MEVKRKEINNVRTSLLILTNNENKMNMLTSKTKINSVSAVEFEKRCNDIVINLREQFFKSDSSSKYTFSSKTNLINIRKLTSNNNLSPSNTPKTCNISEETFNDFLTTLHSKSSIAYKKLLNFENKYIPNNKLEYQTQRPSQLTLNNIKSPKLKEISNTSFEKILVLTKNNTKKPTNEKVKIDNVLDYINRDKDFMNDKITKTRIWKGFQFLRGLAMKFKLIQEGKHNNVQSSKNNNNQRLLNKMTQILMLKENIEFEETSVKRSKSLKKRSVSELPKIIKKSHLSSQKSIDHIVLMPSENQCALIIKPKSRFSFSLLYPEEDFKEISQNEFYSTTAQTIEKQFIPEQRNIFEEYSESQNKANGVTINNKNTYKMEILKKESISDLKINDNQQRYTFINTSFGSISSNNRKNSCSSGSDEQSESFLSPIHLSEVSNSNYSECTEVMFTLSSQDSFKENNDKTIKKKRKSRSYIFKIR